MLAYALLRFLVITRIHVPVSFLFDRNVFWRLRRISYNIALLSRFNSTRNSTVIHCAMIIRTSYATDAVNADVTGTIFGSVLRPSQDNTPCRYGLMSTAIITASREGKRERETRASWANLGEWMPSSGLVRMKKYGTYTKATGMSVCINLCKFERNVKRKPVQWPQWECSFENVVFSRWDSELGRFLDRS